MPNETPDDQPLPPFCWLSSPWFSGFRCVASFPSGPTLRFCTSGSHSLAHSSSLPSPAFAGWPDSCLSDNSRGQHFSDHPVQNGLLCFISLPVPFATLITVYSCCDFKRFRLSPQVRKLHKVVDALLAASARCLGPCTSSE